MLKVQEGDVDRLGLLFERYHKILLAFFYRIHGDAGTSEDLVQNVFMRILKYKHGFKGEGSFKVWMFHIARNVSNDQFRKYKRQVDSPMETWQEAVDEGNEDTERKEFLDKKLEMALNALSQEKRELIVLSKLQGMKYAEVAALHDTTEGNIKVRVFRAIRDLKRKMEEINVNEQ